MIRPLAGLTLSLLLLLLSAGAAGAQEPATGTTAASPSAVQTELRLERSLLSLDLVSYNEARERARRTQQAVNDVLARLDQALAGDSVSLGTLEALQDDLDAARAAARITEDRLSAHLERIQERLRRIGLLDGGSAGGQRAADPLTGRWRVAVLPQNATATFDLRLNGTVVSGSYQVDGGSAGSFRGTYAGGTLRLERIDARGGFDSVWEGTVGNGRITGTWMSNQLATGQPNRGDWTAVRESGQQP
ncbi:MAG TPA: hypothetical protein VHC97_15665 [Thermoanaerobaculia bacterium]|jgi:hypothetical protein|nr:hypothetical protein [Thermoanaerobaculia bacterium]